MTANRSETIPGTNYSVGESFTVGRTTMTILGYKIGSTEELPVLLDVEFRKRRTREKALEELSPPEALGLIEANPDQVTLARSITLESLREFLEELSTN